MVTYVRNPNGTYRVETTKYPSQNFSEYRKRAAEAKAKAEAEAKDAEAKALSTIGGRRKSRRHHKSRHHKKRRHTSRRR